MTCRSHPHIAAPAPIPTTGPTAHPTVTAAVTAAAAHLAAQRARHAARTAAHPNVRNISDEIPTTTGPATAGADPATTPPKRAPNTPNKPQRDAEHAKPSADLPPPF